MVEWPSLGLELRKPCETLPSGMHKLDKFYKFNSSSIQVENGI